MRITLTSIFLVSLVTLCAQTIDTFPYSTGFEGVEGTLNENYPPGWTSEDLNVSDLGNQTWQIIKNTDLVENAHTDSTAVHMFSHFSETNDDWLFTPGVQMIAGNLYELSYWYKISGGFGDSEALAVHVGTAASAAAMTDELWSDDAILNTDYAQNTTSFVPAEDGVYYFGFHYFSPAFTFILLLDDIEIQESFNFDVAEWQAGEDYLMRQAGHVLHLEILNANAQGMTWHLSDIQGRTIRNEVLSSSQISFDLSNEGSGAYIIQLRDTDGVIRLRQTILR